MTAAAEAIMGYVREVASARSDIVVSPPFTVILARGNPGPHWNYAVPDDQAEPEPAQVQALVAVFRERGLTPRVELVPEAAPAAGPALEAAGFRVEEDLPLLTCDRNSLVELPCPDAVTLRVPETDSELLAMASMQHRNFGEPMPAGAADVQHHRRSLDTGGLLLTAVDGSGATVGAGVAAPERARTREIIGVAVEPELRRRGIAGAIVSALTARALATGCETVFLEAAPGASGAYRRAGFRPSSRVVHYAG